jgi:flagellar motor component MotA
MTEKNQVTQESMIAKCMKHCRWCPLIPLVVGITALLLGYFLDPETIRTIWMIGASLVVLMGICGLVMMGVMKRKFTSGSKPSCCAQSEETEKSDQQEG